MMKSLILLAALALPAPLLAADGEGTPRTLRVVNDTSAPVNQLFVIASKAGGLKSKVKGIFGTDDDDRDRLDTVMLPRSGSVIVKLDGKRCRYDVRAVLEDGRTYLADDFDVCANGNWAIASGRLR